MRASDRSILRLTPVQRGFLEELRGTRYIACAAPAISLARARAAPPTSRMEW